MIPSNALNSEVVVKVLPSKNYKMNVSELYINGFVDSKLAMRQVIYKILNTQRYKYIVYSFGYGVEIDDLIGMPVGYVCIEAKRRIIEALIIDDRIVDVRDFDFDISVRGIVKASFVVDTVFGEINASKEVGL